MDIGKLITVEYWPHTNEWRILVAGVAVGYWDTEDGARLRARWVRRALRAATANLLIAVEHAAGLIDRIEDNQLGSTPEGQALRAAIAQVRGTGKNNVR